MFAKTHQIWFQNNSRHIHWIKIEKIPKFLQLEIQILFMDMDFIYKGPVVLSILCLNIHLVFVLFVMNI